MRTIEVIFFILLLLLVVGILALRRWGKNIDHD